MPAKTQLAVKSVIHAPGFENAPADVSVWLQGPADKAPKQVGQTERVTLKSAKDNEVSLTIDAPETADEYKLTLKVGKATGEADDTNNEKSTFLDVTKEGVSILWVDRPRAFEPQSIIRALKGDRRFRVHLAIPEDRPAAPGEDWYEFEKKRYDVVVIGDVSARRFHRGNIKMLDTLAELVRDKKTGLLLLGGYDTFAARRLGPDAACPAIARDARQPGPARGAGAGDADRGGAQAAFPVPHAR